MTAALLNLVVEQGSDTIKTLTWSDEEGRSLVGCSARCSFAAHPGATPVLTLSSENGGIILDPTLNTITLRISAANSWLLTARKYAYDVLIIWIDTTASRLLQGTVTVSPGVTPWPFSEHPANPALLFDLKQDVLVSGTNIRTINGESLLGEGDIFVGGGGGGGSISLSYTASPTNGTVVNSSGPDAVIPLSDGTNAGLMAPAQHTKLAGIESGAQVNTVTSVAGKTGVVALTAGDVSGLGTSAILDVPTSGNAATGQIVKGNDTRLTDARTPTAHTHTAAAVIDFATSVDTRIAASSINSLADVTVANPVTGQVIKWNGTAWVNDTDAGGSGATNLSYTPSPTGGLLVSDTGTDATLTLADSTNAGLMAPAQYSKLASVASGATANATDAQLRDRNTHTGVQAINTVSGLQLALDNKEAVGVAASAVADHVAAADPHPLYTLASALGTAAALNVPASGNATSTQVVKGNDTRLSDARTPVAHTHDISNVSGLQTALDGKETAGAAAAAAAASIPLSLAGAANGVAPLGADQKVPSIYMPSTDAVAEGSVNLYHTPTRVRSTVLTGLDTVTAASVTAADTVLAAIGKLVALLAGKVDTTDGRLSNAREWSAATVDQATAEAGTSTVRLAWTAQSVRQAIAAWWAATASTLLKTINGQSIIGGGDLTVGGAGYEGVSSAGTGALSIASGAIASSLPGIDISQTWNNAAATFSAQKVAVTKTAASANSVLAQFSVNGTTHVEIPSAYAGISVLPNSAFPMILATNGSGWTWLYCGAAGASQTFAFNHSAELHATVATGAFVIANDTRLCRDASGVSANRNGTNAQQHRVYGTYSDASNYRRVALGMSTAGVAYLRAEGGGSGASGNVLHISGLPTANPGPGILWNDAGTVKVGT